MLRLATLVIFAATYSLFAGGAEARRIAPSPSFSVELVDARGIALDTFRHHGNTYILGDQGDRYGIRVRNRSSQRVEAVLSVDGLDVVDGKSANFRTKRGYIVPAHGEIVVEGFRVSTKGVAAFRFSSVSASYASRKGKGRNVGVIGLAIFQEKADSVIAHPVGGWGGNRGWRESRPKKEQSPQLDSESADSPGPRRPSAEVTSSAAGRSSRRGLEDDRAKDKQRPGLGTQFGERRHSAVTFRKFQRRSNSPSLVRVLHYNDARGLRAIGIRFDHGIRDEALARENARAFPASDARFSQPPSCLGFCD